MHIEQLCSTQLSNKLLVNPGLGVGSLFTKFLVEEGKDFVLKLLRVAFWLSQWVPYVIQPVVDLLLNAQVFCPPLLTSEVRHRQVHLEVVVNLTNSK